MDELRLKCRCHNREFRSLWIIIATAVSLCYSFSYPVSTAGTQAGHFGRWIQRNQAVSRIILCAGVFFFQATIRCGYHGTVWDLQIVYRGLGVACKHEDWILCCAICHIYLVRHVLNVPTVFNTSNRNAFSRALVGELSVVLSCLIIPRIMNMLPSRHLTTLNFYSYNIWRLPIVPSAFFVQ